MNKPLLDVNGAAEYDMNFSERESKNRNRMYMQCEQSIMLRTDLPMSTSQLGICCFQDPPEMFISHYDTHRIRAEKSESTRQSEVHITSLKTYT